MLGMYCKNFVGILVHKWFVLVAGFRTNVGLWQLLVHDLSKFSLSEFPHYARKFYGDGQNDEEFALAWLHHENYNPHHWNHWVPRSGKFKGVPRKMPERYVREMVADWLAASRSYEGAWPTSLAEWGWFQANFNNLELHDDTRALVLAVLDQVGVR